MMEKMFLQVLNMSFTASLVIVFVLAARLFLKKVPRAFTCALWSVVLFRLICPFSFESMYSILPVRINPISPDIAYMQALQIDTGFAYINNSVNSLLPPAAPYASVNPLQIWIYTGSLLWIAGIAILLAYSFLSLARLQKRLKDATLHEKNIFISDKIDTAFVIGVFHPKIYLPCNLEDEELRYILLHEQTHIRRFDHITRLLSFTALCLHWFNPLVWAAFYFSSRDIEMSCDEAVIRQLGSDIKKSYSASLLSISTGKRPSAASPLAFGEGDTRERIRNVLNYKKPAFWVIGVSLTVILIIGAGLLADPKSEPVMLAPDDSISSINKGDSSAISDLYASKTEALPQYDAAGLWNAKTEYAGNSSAVGRLVYLLPVPDGLKYDHIELQTSIRPYGISIYYRLTEGSIDKYDTPDSTASGLFRKNALLLLSLVDNAGKISAVITDGNRELEFVNDREWADSIAGGDIREYAASPQKIQQLIELDRNTVSSAEPLDIAIHEAILENNRNGYRKSDISLESHVVLETETSGSPGSDRESENVTVYAMVLYLEYDLKDGKIDPSTESGSHIPIAMTFDIRADGSYLLREYWQPRDGSYYKPDIEGKFPKSAWRSALDTQRFIERQQKNIDRELVARGYMDDQKK